MIVTGPCFEESYNITCAFGGREVEGIYISEQQALCISPQLPSFGRLTFKLTLQNATGIVFEGETILFSCKYFYIMEMETRSIVYMSQCR